MPPWKEPSGSLGVAPDRAWVARYKSWLISNRLSPVTADIYGGILVKSASNPAAYFHALRSRSGWEKARGAWRSVSEWLARPALWDDVRSIPGPRRGPRRVRAVPSEVDWVRIARRVWRVPGPRGAAAWIVCWSSLRIGDVSRLTADQIAEAIGRGETVCFQKGAGGARPRRWIPGPLARIGLVRLAHETGYMYLWELLSRSRDGAHKRIRRCFPAPFTPHSFRHAVITYLVRLGVPLPTIQSITGHESLSALERYIRLHIAVTPTQTYEAQADLARWILGVAGVQ